MNPFSGNPNTLKNLKAVAYWWEWAKLIIILLVISVFSGVWVMCAHAQHSSTGQFYHYDLSPQQRQQQDFWHEMDERWHIDHERQQYEADQMRMRGDMEMQQMDLQNQIDAMVRQLERIGTP